MKLKHLALLALLVGAGASPGAVVFACGHLRVLPLAHLHRQQEPFLRGRHNGADRQRLRLWPRLRPQLHFPPECRRRPRVERDLLPDHLAAGQRQRRRLDQLERPDRHRHHPLPRHLEHAFRAAHAARHGRRGLDAHLHRHPGRGRRRTPAGTTRGGARCARRTSRRRTRPSSAGTSAPACAGTWARISCAPSSTRNMPTAAARRVRPTLRSGALDFGWRFR